MLFQLKILDKSKNKLIKFAFKNPGFTDNINAPITSFFCEVTEP